MADEHEIETVYNLMLANYSYFQREKEAGELAALLDIWKQLLADIDADVLKAAALQHIAESKWFPAIADLREIAARVMYPRRVGAIEAWGEVVQQLHYPGSWGTPVFSDPITEQVVEQMKWSELCASEKMADDRHKFITLWNELAQREKANAIMLPQVRDVIVQLAEARRLPQLAERAERAQK